MLSLIVPLAMGYLAVRAIASGLTGAAESGRLDVLLSAPVSRGRVVAAGFLATAVELAAVLARHRAADRPRQPPRRLRPRRRPRRRRLRQRLAAGPALRRLRRDRRRLLAAHQRRHRLGRRRAGGDVRRRPDRPARHRPLRPPLPLRLQVLRQRDRRRHRTRSPSSASPSPPAPSPRSAPGCSSGATWRPELRRLEDEPEGVLDLSHLLGVDFTQVPQSRERATPRIPRQIATLGLSIRCSAQSAVAEADGATELRKRDDDYQLVRLSDQNLICGDDDCGPVLSRLTRRAAPNAASQISPRRGLSRFRLPGVPSHSRYSARASGLSSLGPGRFALRAKRVRPLGPLAPVR